VWRRDRPASGQDGDLDATIARARRGYGDPSPFSFAAIGRVSPKPWTSKVQVARGRSRVVRVAVDAEVALQLPGQGRGGRLHRSLGARRQRRLVDRAPALASTSGRPTGAFPMSRLTCARRLIWFGHLDSEGDAIAGL
jgi:hypothetical protein